ncbi:hypothetical protein [Lysobacter sp. CA199]|uniref:hypothetical protein n=1 Tax=Lysobacter sp. CA199 TaxID=3455608 RepID=UPI003F8CFBE1
MKTFTLRALLTTGAMICAGMAHAALPTALAKHGPASIIVGMHISIPTDCVQPTTNAINTWNAVGANFILVPDFFISTPRIEDQTDAYDRANVTIDDGILQDARATMGTRLKWNLTTKIIDYADIRVDKRRLRNLDPTQVQFSCLEPIPLESLDWQSVILHEFGHVVGFDHDATDRACAMFPEFGPGDSQRTLCQAEKQAYIDNYKALRITSIPDVSGPQQVNIPAKIYYAGTPVFPVQRKTKNIQCASGWSCSSYDGSYPNSAPSPLTFNFKCTPGDPLPTAVFKWRTTLVDANGVVTNAVDHTSTCTRPAGSLKERPSGEPKRINRVIITD